MNKLLIADLAPYLPYNLKMIFEKSGRIIDLRGITISDSGYLLFQSEDKLFDQEFYKFKPILKPLSELTQEELWNNKFDSHLDYLTHELQNPKNKDRLDRHGRPLWRVKHAPYEMIEYLFSKHYDVFGLIEQNLAVSSSNLE